MFQKMSEKAAIISIELKSGLIIQGKLGHVDKYLNFNLYDINVDVEKWPHFVSFQRISPFLLVFGIN